MNIKDLSTLKIHKLSQEQYDRIAAAGEIDEEAIYLTPDGSSGGGSGVSVIDVIELPTENIQEGVFYRLLKPRFVYGANATDIKCIVVTELPETGEPCYDSETTRGVGYYNLSNGEVYGYSTDEVAEELGCEAGWGPINYLTLYTYDTFMGVITNIQEAIDSGLVYLLLEYEFYHYKNGWARLNGAGRSGSIPSAEVFNDFVSNIASGSCSHAEGDSTRATGEASHSEGGDTTASGVCAHAEGSEVVASGYSSHAEGSCTRAYGDYSHAEGDSTLASGESSHAEGLGTTAKCGRQHAQGEYNIPDPDADPEDSSVRGRYAHIVGNGTSSIARSNAHTLDWSGNAWFAGNVYVGGAKQDDTEAKRLLTEDDLSGVGGSGAAIIDVVELPETDIREDCFYRVLTPKFMYEGAELGGSVICVTQLPEVGTDFEQYDTNDSLIPYAYYNLTDGEVYGYFTEESADSFGVDTGWQTVNDVIAGTWDNFIGTTTNIQDTIDSGCVHLLLEYSLYHYRDMWIRVNPEQIGYRGSGIMSDTFNSLTNIASGYESHAEGGSTTASGDRSHAEGRRTTASGSYSHAEGDNTTASGDGSHAEGYNTTASGDFSHAEGWGTAASGGQSHAEGMSATSSGQNSHAEGRGTTANSKCQHAQGEYNIPDPDADPDDPYARGRYAHIVGNGKSGNTRSNAHTLDWDGNAWYAGYVEGTALILKSPNGTRFRITVDDNGNLSASAVTE